MQFNPHELKEKLLKALDKDQNVVDMCKVQEVISVLEKYPVTREVLEQTRIGRTVNDLRKKTKNPDLAKRAKKLVRKWQTLITPSTPGTPNVGINGEGVAGQCPGPGAGPPGPHLPPHVMPGSKPSSPASRPSTPYSGGKSSNASPLLPSRPTTPATQHMARISPKSGTSLRPNTPSSFKPASPALATSTPVGGATNFKPGIVDTPCSHRASNDPLAGKNISDASSKTNIANKRKRRADQSISPGIPDKKSKESMKSSTNGDHSQSKKLNGMPPSASQMPNGNTNDNDKSSFSIRKNANLSIKTPVHDHRLERTGSSNSLHSDRSGTPVTRTPISARTPKVKTTAQLIKDLQSRKDLNISGSETVTKITRNQIQKEHEADVSIVPAGAKPRPRRTPGASLNPPMTSDIALSRTKNEMVHKFLETSINATETDLPSLHLNGPMTPITEGESHPVVETPTVDSSNVDSGHASLSSAKDDHLMTSPPIRDEDGSSKKSQLLTYINEQHPHIASMNLDEEEVTRLISEDPFALLPPLDHNSTVQCDKDSPPPEGDSPRESTSATEEDVNRLQSENWPGVNGHFDHNHDWHDWTQTCSLPTVNGDLLHILPYVCLDD